MKTKLLKKVRKQFEIVYREECYRQVFSKIISGKREFIDEHFKLTHYGFFTKYTHYRSNKEDCLEVIIDVLRNKYSNLGHFNRKRIKQQKEEELKNKEVKVWYNVKK